MIVYNNVEQHKEHASQLTINEWNDVINILSRQTNINSEYLEKLITILFKGKIDNYPSGMIDKLMDLLNNYGVVIISPDMTKPISVMNAVGIMIDGIYYTTNYGNNWYKVSANNYHLIQISDVVPVDEDCIIWVDTEINEIDIDLISTVEGLVGKHKEIDSKTLEEMI